MLTEYDAESEGEGAASDESSLTEEEIQDSIDVFEHEE